MEEREEPYTVESVVPGRRARPAHVRRSMTRPTASAPVVSVCSKATPWCFASASAYVVTLAPVDVAGAGGAVTHRSAVHLRNTEDGGSQALLGAAESDQMALVRGDAAARARGGVGVEGGDGLELV